jgi:hypothetical protein
LLVRLFEGSFVFQVVKVIEDVIPVASNTVTITSAGNPEKSVPGTEINPFIFGRFMVVEVVLTPNVYFWTRL